MNQYPTNLTDNQWRYRKIFRCVIAKAQIFSQKYSMAQSFALFANDNLEKGLFGRVAVAEGATKA